MLEESARSRRDEKRVWLGVGRPGLQPFLEVVLREWHYLPCQEAVEDGLLLAEEGEIEPPAHQQTIWLSPSAYASHGRLQFPIDISELYALLERRYHNPPRRHLRLALDEACELQVAEGRRPATLSSLSDRGCRLSYPAELVRDTRVELLLDQVDMPASLPGKVIYCVPRHQPDNQCYYDVGLLFPDIDWKLRKGLLDYIVASYFLKAKVQMSAAEFSSALGCFAVSDRVRESLAG